MIERIMAWLKTFSDWQTAPLRQKIENQKWEIEQLLAEVKKLRAKLPAIPVEAIPDPAVSFINMGQMFALVQ